MKYLIVGDIHTTNERLPQVDKLFDIIEEFNLPIILLGDIFDTKDIIRGKCLNLIYRRLKQSKLQFTILVGNHDLLNLETSENSLETLKELPNVLVVDRPWGDSIFTFFPYCKDLNKVKSWMKDHPAEVLFADLP